MPYMKFLYVRPDVFRLLLSDSTSQWTPLLLAIQIPLLGLVRDLHPLEEAHAEHTTTRAATSPLQPFVIVIQEEKGFHLLDTRAKNLPLHTIFLKKRKQKSHCCIFKYYLCHEILCRMQHKYGKNQITEINSTKNLQTFNFNSNGNYKC